MKLRWRRRRRWLGPLGIVPKVGPTHGVSGRHAPGHATMGVSLPLMACSGYSRRATSFQKECPDRWRNGTEFGYRGLTQTWHEKAAAGLRQRLLYTLLPRCDDLRDWSDSSLTGLTKSSRRSLWLFDPPRWMRLASATVYFPSIKSCQAGIRR